MVSIAFQGNIKIYCELDRFLTSLLNRLWDISSVAIHTIFSHKVHTCVSPIFSLQNYVLICSPSFVCTSLIAIHFSIQFLL